MNKKILTVGLSALILSIGVFSASTALAYKGNPEVKGPNYSTDRHQAMTQAFLNNDYNAWKNLMQGKGRVTQVVNEQNFAKFAEAHNLALQGKTTEAQKIRQELGLGLNKGSNGGCGARMGAGRGVNR
jgi:hypothetical protein